MDVSGWQASPASNYSVSTVDWSSQWAMGARFVYVKATEGVNFADRSFSSHFNGASAVGMLRGGYHFALPNQSSAKAQADFFVNNGGGWSADGRTLPPLLDIEPNPYGGDQCYGLSPSAMVSWIKGFSDQVRARTGRLPMIYTGYYWWQDCTANSTAFANQPLHIAAYGASNPLVPGGWNTYSVWQYDDSGVFEGDSNVWNGSLDGLRKFAAGATATVAPKPAPPVPAPVQGPSVPSAADVVAADSAGKLWNYPGSGTGGVGSRRLIGTGWSAARSINVIDWNADGVFDLVAQWKSGSVTVYKGRRTGGFESPFTIGSSGWGNLQLTIGYWLNSSKYPQVLARSTSGELRLWRSSGAGFTGSAVIGSGWGSLNLTMVDFDGDGKQDLLAQDPAGALRLYRSNGAGGFLSEARRTVGIGWANFTSVTVTSDFSGRGTIGLITRSRSGQLAYYPVPGNSYFGRSNIFGIGWSSMSIAGGDTINS